MTIAIIRDETELNKLISLTIQTGKKYRERLHQATMSAAVHLLEYGQPGPLNVLYKSMVSNDSGAFKQWVRRLNLYVGLGVEKVDTMTNKEIGALDPAIKNTYINQNMVIDYADKTFTVLSVKTDPAAKEKRIAGVKLIEQRFLNAPEIAASMNGEDANEYIGKFKPWFERNNFADVRTLGDAQALEQIKRIATNMGLGERKPSGDRVKIVVSERMKAIVKTAMENAESLVENETATASSSREESIVNMAQVARENKTAAGNKAQTVN